MRNDLVEHPGLKSAGAKRVESGVLPRSGEVAPLEAPEALTRALRAFARRVSS